jgi:rare lipoprotein A
MRHLVALVPLVFVAGSSHAGDSTTRVASFYASSFEGRLMADGCPYHGNGRSAASLAYPMGTVLVLTNTANGMRSRIKIEDRGPFVRGRDFDVSHATAMRLGMVKSGTARVMVEVRGAEAIKPCVVDRGGYHGRSSHRRSSRQARETHRAAE